MSSAFTRAIPSPGGPVTLVHAESYERIDEAIAAERRIKGWSRAKKEAYIRGDFETLSALSRRRSKSES
jgi:putative endonuclease